MKERIIITIVISLMVIVGLDQLINSKGQENSKPLYNPDICANNVCAQK